jgi:hypothetical protein
LQPQHLLIRNACTPAHTHRYRRPRNSYKNHKSEVRARHSAFTRGSSYLERYCMLIAFNGYLRDQGLTSSTTFKQWLEGRPELLQALDSIHSNPATALAAVPVTPVTPLVFQPVQQGQVVTPEEQQHVLATRKGRTLNRRIILKSYLSRAPDPSLPPGTPDLRQASHLPIYTIGNSSCSGLRKLLTHLGAGPGGDTHVVLTDVREELVVYVNGVPYTRRELEMPAAALHHAGVHARSLESLEAAMKEVRCCPCTAQALPCIGLGLVTLSKLCSRCLLCARHGLVRCAPTAGCVSTELHASQHHPDSCTYRSAGAAH